jgi:hypothetical protein
MLDYRNVLTLFRRALCAPVLCMSLLLVASVISSTGCRERTEQAERAATKAGVAAGGVETNRYAKTSERTVVQGQHRDKSRRRRNARQRKSGFQVKHSISRESIPSMGISSVGALPVKPLVDIDAEQRAAFNALMNRFRQSEAAEDRTEVLEEMAEDFPSAELLEFIGSVLENDKEQEEVSVSAVKTLQGLAASPAVILSLLDKAIAGGSAAVRLAAIGGVREMTDPAAARLMGKAFADPEAEIRFEATDIVSDLDDGPLKLESLKLALATPHQDVKLQAVGELEFLSNKRSLSVLINALDADDPEVREAIVFSVDWLTDQTFADSAEARQWWEANAHLYGEDLVLKEVSED